MTPRLGLYGALLLCAACSSSSGNTIQTQCLDAVPPNGATCTATEGTTCAYTDVPCIGITTEAICKGGVWAVTVTKGICMPTNDGGAETGGDAGAPDADGGAPDTGGEGGTDAGSG